MKHPVILRLFYILFLLIVNYPLTSAQNQSIIDSLQNLLQNDKLHDTTRINTLNALAWDLKYSNPDTSITISRQALELAENIKWEKGIAKAFNNLGEFNRLMGNYAIAIRYNLQTLTINKKLKDKKSIATTLGNIGYVYANQGDYSIALEYYLKALKIEEELGDKNHIATRLGNIGIVYYYQGEYAKALQYHFKAYKIDKAIGNLIGVSRHTSNIGLVYWSQQDYPKALEYFFESLKMEKSFDNKSGIAFTHGNIGNVYATQGIYTRALEYNFKALNGFEELGDKRGITANLGNIGAIYQNQGDSAVAMGSKSLAILDMYPKALEYDFRALGMTKEMGMKHNQAIILGNIGSVYLKTGKFSEAEIYLDSSLAICYNIGALNESMEFEKILSELYDTTARYRLAYHHYKKYTAAKDSIFNEEKSKEIGYLEAGHEFEKQMLEQDKEHEKQQALGAAELKRQKIIGYSISGGFGLVLILAFFIYRSYRQKKKANQLLKEKNSIIEEAHKEITDSIRYAKNIQSAILPKEMEINKVLPDHLVYFQPKDVVSGDFYWFTQQNGKIYIAACDCTGHGVPGAFVSMIGNDLLNQIIIEQKLDKPSDILTKLNNRVKSVFTREGTEQQAQDGMDMVLCTFDLDLKSLEFAGAKNPLFIIQKGEIISIKGNPYPIGGETEINYSFTNHKIGLQKGNMIYLLSDGYQDQFGGQKGKKFMIKRLKELLLSIQDNSMQEQKELIHKTITDWKGKEPQVDDICVIGIRV